MSGGYIGRDGPNEFDDTCPVCCGEQVDDDGLPCALCGGTGHVTRAMLEYEAQGAAADYAFESAGDR